MEVHNNFSPLAFRKKESKATYEKWYAFGKNYAIPASANTLIPFQFTDVNVGEVQPDSIEVVAVNQETGEGIKTGAYVSRDDMPEHGSVLYVSPGKNSFREALPQGTYRAEFSIGTQFYISTPFCVIPGIETSSKYLLIEYWNDEKIAYPGGFITTGANNDFRYQMYVPATICKPKYEFEEELTKRAGYKFLELQTSTKVYAFTFVAPEFICDAMRLIRLSDYIRISHDGEYYNALNFEFDVDWQEQLYLAAVDCQFETDSIIQKLPSFNRRDKASFYNALLANIDTPIMFSPDTVGLYYKEYRETEPVVKGKLIRELSPIDLIDENTTIAVDLGTGEARKFNLYRMLQDYISKTHEDATDFLLHLRGGATFGEGITGSAASINAVGDAEVQGLNARVTKVKSLDSEDYVTVNKTAFTVNKQGDTALNALNARGDSHLQQDVYTGNNTGKITKEGQLQYLSAVIQEFITSPTFVPGFLGEGFKIWVENGNWHIECDNLTVRQTMNIFELLIQKIRSVNGALVVSQSNGKIKSVSEDETNYVITMEEEGETFQPNDLVRCQVWTGSKAKFYWVEVASVSGNSITVKKSEFTAGNKPEKGDEVVQMGNTQNAQRQALIYITAQESGHPYIEILNGVKTKSLSGTNRTRLGDLSNIQDSAFPEGQQPSGSGLYCDNAFLRGIFLLRNGKSVEDEVTQAKQDAANAATEAERAQQTAQEAKDRLNKWADDGFISPTEKPALIDEGKRIQAEFLQIKNNADKYGVSVTEYTKAYEDYLNELRYHSAQQPEDIAVRPELAKTQTIYYDRRNGALNAIANAAKSYVDEADKKIKEYLDTEITAIPGKIELAVRSLKTANYNLLAESNRVLNSNPYQLGVYRYETHLVVGKSYTLTVCYKCADSSSILAYNNANGGNVAEFPKSDNETIVSVKISPSNEDLTYFEFYKLPQKETTQTYVKWAVITEGDIGVSNWIPSKFEMFSGGSNLVLNSDLCVDYYTVFYLSKTYYELRGQDVAISFDYEYSNLVLGSNNRFGVETEVPLSTGGVQYFGGFVYVDSRSPSNGKGRYFRVLKVSDHVVDNGLKYIQAHVQVGSGTVVKICNFQIEKGNTPTEWKPAPEDILNDSKKYTDTQILAVDGKIELSVKTQLEKTTIGGNNLIDGSKDYWFNRSDYLGNVSLNYNPASNGWMSVLGSGAFNCYKQWMNVDKTAITPGKQYTLGIDVSIGGNYIHEAGLFFNIRYYEGSTAKLVADKTINLTNDTKWTRYYVTLELPSVLPSGVTVNDLFFLCGFTGNNTGTGAGLIVSYKNINLVEGDIGTSWSPSANDTFGKSVEYTTSQIDIVEKKIELKVSSTVYEQGISNTQRIARYLSTGKMLDQHSDVCFSKGLNNITRYNNAGTEGVKIHRASFSGIPNNTGYAAVINTDTSRGNTSPGAGGFGFGNRARYGARFMYKLVAMIPSGKHLQFASNAIGDGSTREWLTDNVGTGKWEEYYYLIKCGDSGALSNSGFFYIEEFGNVEWYLAYATVYDVFGDNSQINKTTYETKITQLESSISLKASQTDLNSATERIRQAEIKLDSTSIKLGVVEGTANDAKSTASSAQSTANAANSLAGTANNKAEAADGRVTATQNGLVETGINITSRKIVLKSDNVLFQNNAGQQTAAINANGKLTANAIEVGEVVAGGFAAQRITTGNLTVTDGAVIGGMTIAGGVLTGKNINIQDGAKIGSFTIVSGIFSAQNTPAGIQMTLSNNAATFDSSGVRVEHNSGGYALTTTGNGRIFLTGSNFWVQCKDVDFMGAQTWKAPGVFYACTILASGAIGKTWGNPDFHITRVTKNSTGRYTVNTTGSNGDYFVMITAYDPTSWLSTTVEPYSEGQFTYKVFDVNKGMRDGGVIIYFCGMVR
jgi:hypothetical protein